MTAMAAGRTSLVTGLKRYGRSWGLWAWLLIGPIGARYMIARDDGSGLQVAVGRHLPILTSSVLGISLGIVVSTMLLPVGFLYLRSNVARRQPWQIEEVTAASRLSIIFGRFLSDVAVMFAMLATLTVAGCFLAWLIVSGPLDILKICGTLWLVAAPAVIGLAAVHRLLDAFPLTRRSFGEVLFFLLWFASLAMPAAVLHERSSLSVNMYDFPGFVRPLVGPAPAGDQDLVVGGGSGMLPGRVPLDVMVGIGARGYVASRMLWTLFALAAVAFAGLLYRPHSPRRSGRLKILASKLLSLGPPPAISSTGAAPAPHVSAPFVGLAAAEARLIGAGRLFKIAAAVAAIAGLFGDYRHVGSPIASLLLIFGLVAQAGRSETKGLLALTVTTAWSPMVRRLAFVIAATGWSVLLALPASIVRLSLEPLMLGATVAAAAATVAIGVAAISHSGFAARLLLLLGWYAYLSM